MSKMSNAIALVSDEVQKLVSVPKLQAKILLNWSFILEMAIVLSAFYGPVNYSYESNEETLNQSYKE